MSGATISLTPVGLDQAIAKMQALTAFEVAELVDDAGGILESSTKRRIGEEKTAPDGTPWPEWSDEYAATREGHHSLLVDENDLLESVQSFSTGSDAIVGSNLVYAARRHFGGEELGFADPGRPYLGMSGRDELDINDLVIGRLGDLLQ